MTLDELREHFWWLGPGRKEKAKDSGKTVYRDSYIVGLEGTTVTIKVIQCTWNRRTQKYEEAVERDFAAIGLQVAWLPFLSPARQAEIDLARGEADKKKEAFDEVAFVERQRREEKRRGPGAQ